MISIVIPTYNEEKYLPKLLDSIKEQSYKDYEIIIADNNSKDKTKQIAKKYGCKIVKGSMPGKARNNGAKAAKHNLLFLDSDIVLPKNFLKTFFKKTNEHKLNYATCLINPMSNNANHIFYYMLKNYGNLLINPIKAHVSGQCLFIEKKLFNKINGYDESLYLGEEHELAQRAKKYGKGKFFTNIFVSSYPRRLIKEGTYKRLFKDIISELYRMFIGPIKKPIFKIKYGHF